MDRNTDFRFKRHKGDRVTIYTGNRAVTSLRGKHALKFLSRVEGAAQKDQQLHMAKATGNFKRGNEKS